MMAVLSLHQQPTVSDIILDSLRENGGEIQSLRKLCKLKGLGYANAFKQVARMAAQDVLTIERPCKRYGMIIRLEKTDDSGR